MKKVEEYDLVVIFSYKERTHDKVIVVRPSIVRFLTQSTSRHLQTAADIDMAFCLSKILPSKDKMTSWKPESSSR